jgi:hypothetical protein
MRIRLPLLAATLTAVAAAGSASGHAVPGAARCPVFPNDNQWNQRVDRLPLVANSRAIVSNIGVDAGVHADFGSGLYNGARIGIPYTIVSKRQRGVRVRFDYSDESDHGRYPIPKNAPSRAAVVRMATDT